MLWKGLSHARRVAPQEDRQAGKQAVGPRFDGSLETNAVHPQQQRRLIGRARARRPTSTSASGDGEAVTVARLLEGSCRKEGDEGGGHGRADEALARTRSRRTRAVLPDAPSH